MTATTSNTLATTAGLSSWEGKKRRVSASCYRHTSIQSRVKRVRKLLRKDRLPVGCPLPQGSVWGTPQPAGAPRAGGCESQGWARWAKLGRSTLELGRAAVLGPRSCCWPESAEGAAASRDSELTRHRCLTLLLQLSQGPSFQIFVLLSVTMA